MALITIIYWLDIPAQVTVKAGRNVLKQQLAKRFQDAIDEAAMISKSYQSAAYLSKWHKSKPILCGNDLETELNNAVKKIEAEFTVQKLKDISRAGGYKKNNN